MGGGPSQNQNGNTITQNRVFVPPALRKQLWPLEQGALGQELQAQGGLPSIEQLYGQVPLQGVAPLTGAQLGTISNYEGLGNGGPNAYESGGIGTLQNYASGGIGQDPATQAALNQYSQLTAPQIQQQASLQGAGNSGAALEAGALGRTAALTPLLQQGEANQLSAGEQLYGAGAGINSQQLNDMAAQLEAEGLPQQEAQNIANSHFQQQQQRFQYANGVQQQPLGLIPSLLGNASASFSSGTSTTGK